MKNELPVVDLLMGFPARTNVARARELLQILQTHFLRCRLAGQPAPDYFATWFAIELGTACPVFPPNIVTVIRS